MPPRPEEEYAPWACDLTHKDLRGLDLRQSLSLLRDYASFDTATRWPPAGRMPLGFNPAQILALGQNPGLGLRSLHARGITGAGVHIAYIDQTLLLDHQEYGDRLVRYRELGSVALEPEMHGAAVASLAVGRSVGAAPGASLTYYAAQYVLPEGGRTFIHVAAAIEEIIQRNEELPPAERVRVIGASIGVGQSDQGVEDLRAAMQRAKEAGVLVVLTNTLPEDYGIEFQGMDRDPLADPDDFGSYRPGIYLRRLYYEAPEQFTGHIWLPMDARTRAGFIGPADYAFDRQGGKSWAVPYLVGVYALALQVRPDLTPEAFFEAAAGTGVFTTLTHEGREYRFGPILDPAGLIEALTRAS